MDTDREAPSDRTGARRRLAALTLGGLATLVLLAACNVPLAPAASTYGAWKANDKAAALKTATPLAADKLFAVKYDKSRGWFFSSCLDEGTTSTCSWVDNMENRMYLKVDKQKNKVVDAGRQKIDFAVMGRFFHAWRVGKPATAAQFGTPEAVTTMFSEKYDPATPWTPDWCSDYTEVHDPPYEVYQCWWRSGTRHLSLTINIKDVSKVYAVYRSGD
ncbi:MAG: hypothetical protein JWM47_1515 [Acidimicrobiales bacterium]|nr:hypothetical protein [Acidimicrobiales bacterium]